MISEGNYSVDLARKQYSQTTFGNMLYSINYHVLLSLLLPILILIHPIPSKYFSYLKLGQPLTNLTLLSFGSLTNLW
jgi:hypothetical protein